jgi:hypothetical protein
MSYQIETYIIVESVLHDTFSVDHACDSWFTASNRSSVPIDGVLVNIFKIFGAAGSSETSYDDDDKAKRTLASCKLYLRHCGFVSLLLGQ